MKRNIRKLFSVNYASREDTVSLDIEFCRQHVSVSPTFVTAVRTFDFWHDSSRQKASIGEWKNRLIATFTYGQLPLTEQMTIQFVDDDTILWTVCLTSPTVLVLDEIKNIVLIHRSYRECFIDGDFYKMPSLSDQWQAIAYKEEDCSHVGARDTIDQSVPDILVGVEESPVSLAGHCEAAPEKLNTYALGFSTIRGEKITITPQQPFLATFQIKIYSDPILLDQDMERQRKQKFGLPSSCVLSEKTTVSHKKDPVVLFANLPWRRLNKRGVRAGSRWPHMRDVSEGEYLPFPFFLAYAAALLKRDGYRAHIIDAIAEDLTEEQFLQKVHCIQPDVVVIETSAPSFYNDMDTALKLSLEDRYIVACGPFSYMYSEQFLKEFPYIDAVFLGEYEETARDFVKALHNDLPLSNVPGMMYRDRENVRTTAQRGLLQLDAMPWPERDSLPMQRYWDMPGGIPFPSVQMISSRGCPFTCDFCLWPQVLYKGVYRARSIKDCIDEMQFLVENKGFKSVYWDDDTFNVSEERTLQFADEILKRSLEHIPWAIMARSDIMTPRMLKKLRQAGLSAVKYGVESIQTCAHQECGKHLNLKKSAEIMKMTKDLGIKMHLTFVFGFDTDTKQSIHQTIDYALKVQPDSLQFSILTPFPGTKLFERLEKEKRLISHNWSFYDGHHGCVFVPQHLASRSIEELKEYAYRRWFDYVRQKRGLKGDIRRFIDYVRHRGVRNAVLKVFDYIKFLLVHRQRVLKSG